MTNDQAEILATFDEAMTHMRRFLEIDGAIEHLIAGRTLVFPSETTVDGREKRRIIVRVCLAVVEHEPPTITARITE